MWVISARSSSFLSVKAIGLVSAYLLILGRESLRYG